LAQGKTRDIVAKYTGVGRTTLKKAEDIIEAAEETQKDINQFFYLLELQSRQPMKLHL
jgi:hypothetical protein